MPEGGRLWISVALEPAAPASTARTPGIRLSVRDDGAGMDEETLGRMFEPFFTTKGAGQGTGLGLATVYAIVQESGGTIQVDSAPRLGTTISIRLPGVAGETLGGEHAKSEEWPSPSPHHLNGPSHCLLPTAYCLLLVEDQPLVRTLALDILAQEGYTLLSAGHPDEALRIAAEHLGPLDLLVADVVMPGMSGRQLWEKLSQERPGLKVLYMSGHTEDAVLRHGVAKDEVAFIQKPFDPARFVARVRELLDPELA
jgi:CheY-like chemotaxis protein